MALISDSKVYKSKETTCNNSTRNCVVYESSIPGKAGSQISITKIGIDIANEKDGVLSTCYITVESGGKEKQLAKWSNSKEDYTPRNVPCEYASVEGGNAKVRVYLKTEDENYSALVKNLLVTWGYISPDMKEEEPEPPEEQEDPSETDTILVVRCSSGVVDSLIAEIQKLAPKAEISTLQKSGT